MELFFTKIKNAIELKCFFEELLYQKIHFYYFISETSENKNHNLQR